MRLALCVNFAIWTAALMGVAAYIDHSAISTILVMLAAVTGALTLIFAIHIGATNGSDKRSDRSVRPWRSF